MSITLAKVIKKMNSQPRISGAEEEGATTATPTAKMELSIIRGDRGSKMTPRKIYSMSI